MWSIVLLTLLISGDELGTQVACTELAFSRSVEERDMDAFTGFLDPDARFTGGGVLRGPAEIRRGWSTFFDAKGPVIRWAPDSIEVLQSADLALSQGPYEIITTGEDGTAKLRAGRFSSVWRRGDDGRWRVIFDGGTPSQPAEAGDVDTAREPLLPICDGEPPTALN